MRIAYTVMFFMVSSVGKMNGRDTALHRPP